MDHSSEVDDPTRKIIGQSKAISSSIRKCNGPIRVHWQCLQETQWAKEKQSTAASANAMGPSECISSASQKYNGPKQSNWQQHPLMQWAHLSASAGPSRNIMGQGEVIGSNIR